MNRWRGISQLCYLGSAFTLFTNLESAIDDLEGEREHIERELKKCPGVLDFNFIWGSKVYVDASLPGQKIEEAFDRVDRTLSGLSKFMEDGRDYNTDMAHRREYLASAKTPLGLMALGFYAGTKAALKRNLWKRLFLLHPFFYLQIYFGLVICPNMAEEFRRRLRVCDIQIADPLSNKA